jgi:hypothetical protein
MAVVEQGSGTSRRRSSATAGAAAQVRNGAEFADAEVTLGPVIRFLESALGAKVKGDSLHYHHLVAQLSKRDDPETLWRLYLGLSHCVPVICGR